jgi:hypothetical protein
MRSPCYASKFCSTTSHPGRRPEEKVLKADLYDFLYEREYAAWFCNAARAGSTLNSCRSLKDWFLKIHTGESLASGTSSWNSDQRQKLGQQYLRQLARDFVKWFETDNSYFKKRYEDDARSIRSGLELDGYVWRDGELVGFHEHGTPLFQEDSP